MRIESAFLCRHSAVIRTAKQVSAYAGLTPRVHQSGGHCYRGSITRQGSAWLRWILVEAAMKAIREDTALKNFYTRVASLCSGVVITSEIHKSGP